jgi:hypothetical protein
VGFQGSEGRLTQACFVTAFQILDIYEGYQDGSESFDSMATNFYNQLMSWGRYFSLVETTKGEAKNE